MSSVRETKVWRILSSNDEAFLDELYDHNDVDVRLMSKKISVILYNKKIGRLNPESTNIISDSILMKSMFDLDIDFSRLNLLLEENLASLANVENSARTHDTARSHDVSRTVEAELVSPLRVEAVAVPHGINIEEIINIHHQFGDHSVQTATPVTLPYNLNIEEMVNNQRRALAVLSSFTNHEITSLTNTMNVINTAGLRKFTKDDVTVIDDGSEFYIRSRRLNKHIPYTISTTEIPDTPNGHDGKYIRIVRDPLTGIFTVDYIDFYLDSNGFRQNKISKTNTMKVSNFQEFRNFTSNDDFKVEVVDYGGKFVIKIPDGSKKDIPYADVIEDTVLPNGKIIRITFDYQNKVYTVDYI